MKNVVGVGKGTLWCSICQVNLHHSNNTKTCPGSLLLNSRIKMSILTTLIHKMADNYWRISPSSTQKQLWSKHMFKKEQHVMQFNAHILSGVIFISFKGVFNILAFGVQTFILVKLLCKQAACFPISLSTQLTLYQAYYSTNKQANRYCSHPYG